MKVAPMILRFVSGSDDARQPLQEQRRGVHEHQRQLEALEPLANLCGLVEPQDAVVHEDTRQLVADRFVEDERRDRRVDAAAQRADDPPAAHLRANPRRRLLDKRRHRPVAGAAADAGGEVAKDVEAALRVDHFGMEQQRVEPAIGVGHGGDRCVGAGRDHREAGGRGCDEIAMTGPDAKLRRHVHEQGGRIEPRAAATRVTVSTAARVRPCQGRDRLGRDRLRALTRRRRPVDADGRGGRIPVAGPARPARPARPP